MTAAFLDAPDGLDALLGELEGVTVRRALRGHADLVCASSPGARPRARARPRCARARARRDGVGPWPKRAAGVATDMTEDVVREVALPTGLVDTKVAAIDATWSGLKLMVRRELR